MRRNVDHQEAHQGGQVKVVQVQRLLQEIDVGKRYKEENDANAVPEAEGYAGRQHPEHEEVQIHTVSWPRLHPTKPVVREVEAGIDVVRSDPAVDKILRHLPDHDSAESDAEEYEGGYINRREEATQEYAAGQRQPFAGLARFSRICRLKLNVTPLRATREGACSLVLESNSRRFSRRVLALNSSEKIVNISQYAVNPQPDQLPNKIS